MKSKSLFVIVAAIVTGASGCGSSPASRISSGPHPVPIIKSINPTAAVAGGPGFTLGIGGGANFVVGCSDLSTPCVQGSIVQWNGTDRPTIVFPYTYSCSPAPKCTGYGDAGDVATAQIPASDIAEPGTAEISVFSPAPGGGTSNAVTFTIAAHGVFPSSVAVHPAGTFAYVTNSGSDNVSTYAINTDGTLTFKTTMAAGRRPVSIAVHRSGKFAYVANTGDGIVPASVSMYTIDTTTGALTPNGEITNDRSNVVVVDPSGRFAYVGSGGVSMYSIDTTTGKLTSMGTVDAAGDVLSLAVHPSGNFAYATVGLPGCRFNCPPPAASYVLAYTLNTTTGVLVSNGTTPTEQSPSSIAIAPSGKFAYVANYNSHSISMYTIDAITGTLTLIGTIGT